DREAGRRKDAAPLLSVEESLPAGKRQEPPPASPSRSSVPATATRGIDLRRRYSSVSAESRPAEIPLRRAGRPWPVAIRDSDSIRKHPAWPLPTCDRRRSTHPTCPKHFRQSQDRTKPRNSWDRVQPARGVKALRQSSLFFQSLPLPARVLVVAPDHPPTEPECDEPTGEPLFVMKIARKIATGIVPQPDWHPARPSTRPPLPPAS